jgi:hypothetical protein
MRRDIFRQHTETVAARRSALFRFCTLGAGRIRMLFSVEEILIKVFYCGREWKEYCILNVGFYLYKPTMTVVFMHPDVLDSK